MSCSLSRSLRSADLGKARDFLTTSFFFFFLDRPAVQSPTDHPRNLTLEEGKTARFTCKTIGNPPTETHKWQFKGKDIPGESCKQCSSTTLSFQANRSDTGWYSCIGSNGLGEGPPARAYLLVKCKLLEQHLYY